MCSGVEVKRRFKLRCRWPRFRGCKLANWPGIDGCGASSTFTAGTPPTKRSTLSMSCRGIDGVVRRRRPLFALQPELRAPPRDNDSVHAAGCESDFFVGPH